MKIARLVLLLPLFSVCALALPHPGPAKPALASPQTRAVNSSSAKPVLCKKRIFPQFSQVNFRQRVKRPANCAKDHFFRSVVEHFGIRPDNGFRN